MEINDYKICIKNSSLRDRLRLTQVFLDNSQKIYVETDIHLPEYKREVFIYCKKEKDWSGDDKVESNISLEDFIHKFKKSNEIRNIAFYKRSGREWTQAEMNTIQRYIGNSSLFSDIDTTYKYLFDDGVEDIRDSYAIWGTQEEHKNFKNCLQVAYEDCFIEDTTDHKEGTSGLVNNYMGYEKQKFKEGQVWEDVFSHELFTILSNCESEDLKVLRGTELCFTSKKYIQKNCKLKKDVKKIKQLDKGSKMNNNIENEMTQLKILEMRLINEKLKREIAVLKPVKDTKPKTDLESRGKFTAVVYDEKGKYSDTRYFKSMKKAEKFKTEVLSTKEGYGLTVTLHQEVSVYSTKAPIVQVK